MIPSFQPAQSKFANDPRGGLLRCQAFVSQWLLILTIWSSRIRPPFPGGPHFEPIQMSMLQMVGESCTEVLQFVQQVAACQFHIQTLPAPAFSGQSEVAQGGQAAWSRIQAVGFACGLIRVLEVADSCFSFGPHFIGGDNAARREAHFSSLEQRAYAMGYEAAVRQLAAIEDPSTEQTDSNGHEQIFSPLDRGDIDTFAERTLPTARVVLQTAWLGCDKTLKMSGRLIIAGRDSPTEVPAGFSAEAELFFAYGDKALKAAEALFDCIPAFLVALREIGEDNLAALLESIAQLAN